jgi:CRISPR-associated protein Cmr3
MARRWCRPGLRWRRAPCAARMLADDGVDLAAFAQGRVTHPLLGTPQRRAPFTVAGFHAGAAAGRWPRGVAAPAARRPGRPGRREGRRAAPAAAGVPTAPAAGLASSAALPLLAGAAAGRAWQAGLGGVWLTQAGWAELSGRADAGRETDLLKTSGRCGAWTTASAWAWMPSGAVPPTASCSQCRPWPCATAWAFWPASRRRAAVPRPAAPGRRRPRRCLCESRAIRRWPWTWLPSSLPAAAACAAHHPGPVCRGWRLPGTDADLRLRWPGLSARLVCAAVPRADVVSGWDLAQRAAQARASAPRPPAASTGSTTWRPRPSARQACRAGPVDARALRRCPAPRRGLQPLQLCPSVSRAELNS